MKIISSIFTIFFLTLVFGQKKTIDHTTYDKWKKIENQIVSNDGNFVAYWVTPLKGDGILYVQDLKNNKQDSIIRAQKPTFIESGKILVFKITPGYDTLRKCELKKIDKTKWPKDSLGIYFIESDSLVKIPAVKSFSVAEEGDWIAYTVDSNELKDGKEKKKKHYLLKKNKPVAYKSDGKLLTVYHPLSNKKYQFKDVTSFFISKKGTYIAFTQHQKIKKDSSQLVLLDTKSGKSYPDKVKKTYFSELVFNEQETQLAFLCSKDTAKNKFVDLALYDLSSFTWKTLVDTSHSIIPKTKSVSVNRIPLFTEDGKALYFGIADRPKPEQKDTLLESEKYKLDLWHYKDKRLQPQQLIELKKDEKKNDLCIYHLSDNKIVQLSNDTVRVSPKSQLIGDYLLGYNIDPYQATYNWTSPNLEDHYRINAKTGTIELLKKGVGFGGELSPSGKFYTYFDGEKGQHILLDLDKKIEQCITCTSKKVNWQRDINGMPEIASPFATIGWLKGENDLLIQSEYDLWNYNVKTSRLTSLTNEEGFTNKIKLEPYFWSDDSIYVDFENLYLNGMNDKTKGRSIYKIHRHGDHTDMRLLYSTPMELTLVMRSKNKETILLRKMSVKDYPDIYITGANFTNEKRISTINPQQSEYNWATVEMIDYKSYDGQDLKALLYKPEDFDPSKKYPLLVYYYELYTDEINNYYAPKPSASVISPTEYASAGYFVVIPDIRYVPGHPAKSAYNCIMGVTDKVLKLYPAVDSSRMGLQGQSWGGYQTAQLITMTTRYKAAMAGAPVSNMFSAYGGIRWGSGLNRQFQYEKQQSRIGKTIWEAPELYIENSPLFHLPKVKTPLLIMSNDEDGAVPWYQGIELFTAMKRLDKPCWLLNYNGDDHNLMKNPNRMDLSIRMRQFFDYYLQGKPAPLWLTDGIPAIDKGKVTGYESH